MTRNRPQRSAAAPPGPALPAPAPEASQAAPVPQAASVPQTSQTAPVSQASKVSQTAPVPQAAPRPRAFVLLARTLGASARRARFERGMLPGLNEPLPYGYFHAEQDGIAVHYSEDAPEGPLGKTLRLALRALCGFDLLHAWRHRRQIAAADIVWTHTESQSLGVALVTRLLPRRRRPRLLLQQIWLIDRWPRLGPLHRALYRALLRRADLLTFHSPLNTAEARRLFPGQRCEMLRYGIVCGPKRPPRRPGTGPVLEVVSLGNDRHRDWQTLVAAVAGQPGIRLTVASETAPLRLLAGHANIRLLRPERQAEILALYEGADVLALALKPNLHVSGCTVAQEAAVMGLPMVLSDTGGLREAYFGADCASYVPPGDALALRAALLAQRADPAAAQARARAAQRRMSEAGLSSRAFARDHARLSREILAAPAPHRR
jgi:glycosyltransferase involved in cell wall biosynthesis